MGEYADEAMQLDYGRVDNNDPKYNEDLWKDCYGTIRRIKDMDSMHLRFTIDYIKTLDCARKMRGRISKMERELKCRGFAEDEYEFHKVGCDLGLYCMYHNEKDNRIRWH